MRRCVATDVSRDRSAFIFRVSLLGLLEPQKKKRHYHSLNMLISCKFNHHVNNSFEMPLIITLKRYKTRRSTCKTPTHFTI